MIPHILAHPQQFGRSAWSAAQSAAALAGLGIFGQWLADLLGWSFALLPLVTFCLALLIFWKKSADPVALLYATVFLVFFAPFSSLAEIYPAWKIVGDIADSFSTALLIACLYLFPDGRFRPGWTRWTALAMTLIQAWRLFQPEIYQQNFALIVPVFFITIPIALVYRYVRLSSATQRQQIKWVVYGLAVSLTPLSIFVLVFFTSPGVQQPTAAGMAVFLIGNALWFFFAIALPVSFFLAIFRSGLWEIDLELIRKLKRVEENDVSGYKWGSRKPSRSRIRHEKAYHKTQERQIS